MTLNFGRLRLFFVIHKQLYGKIDLKFFLTYIQRRKTVKRGKKNEESEKRINHCTGIGGSVQSDGML